MPTKRSLTVLLLMAVGAPAMAALPPYYQRGAELRAIIESPALAKALKSQPIDMIQYVASDQYRVQAGTCNARVTLRDVPRDSPGPRLFTVHVSAVKCTKG